MRRPLLILILYAPIVGCGSGTHQAATSAATPSTTPNSTAQLEHAVRTAISEDHALSVQALWTNSVPANPPATAGPELAILRKSVAQRRAQRVRIRTVSEHFRVLAVELNPSYATATATVLDDQQVQPSYPNGRPRGKSVSLHEHVRLELHRLGTSERFVVWKVVLLP